MVYGIWNMAFRILIMEYTMEYSGNVFWDDDEDPTLKRKEFIII